MQEREGLPGHVLKGLNEAAATGWRRFGSRGDRLSWELARTVRADAWPTALPKHTHTQQNPTSNIHPAPRVCEGQTSKALTPWGEGLSSLKHILLLSGPMLVPLSLLCSSLQTQLASPRPLRPAHQLSGSLPQALLPAQGLCTCYGMLSATNSYTSFGL